MAWDLYDVRRDVREALELAQISPFVASMIVQATRRLPDTTRRLLDEAVTADAVEQPAGRVIAAARARVSEADEDADKAAQRAALDRRLFLKPMDDGQAMLGAVLSADDAVRAFTRCDNVARARKHAGASVMLDRLSSDAFTAIMLSSRADAAAPATPTVGAGGPPDDTGRVTNGWTIRSTFQAGSAGSKDSAPRSNASTRNKTPPSRRDRDPAAA